MPQPSSLLRSIFLRFCLRMKPMQRIATAARGMLKANIQRQPGTCTNQPPRMGPSTVDTEKTAPMRPRYLPTCLAGTTSAMIAWERIMRPPAPAPAMKRPTMRNTIDGVMAQTPEPMM